MMWEVIYWVLLVIALVVLGRGLLWDRAGFRGRPKRRCRRCWYDLTGVDGDVSREPVVCPECGKTHKTKRSMRKTRRGKRWVLAAVVVWLMAYGASVTPRVQQNGWGAAVPRVVLVMSMPFISEEPGSGLTTTIWMPVTTITISPYEKLLLKEIEREWQSRWYNPQGNQGRFGWVSRRLAFLLARLESESDLCNGTTAKGMAYQCLLTALVMEDRAYEFEEKWARAQNEVDIEFKRGFGVDEPVFGRVRLNTLIRDIETVRFGNPSVTYSVQAMPNRSGFGSGSGPGPAGATPQERDQSLINANRWASLWNLKDDSGYSTFDSQTFPLGNGYIDGNGVPQVSVSFRFGRYARDEEGRWDREADPVSMHHEVVQVPYPIDTTRTIQRDSTQQLKDWIERSFVPRLGVEFNGKEQSWVPVIKLEPKTQEAWAGGSLVFGGYIRVCEVPTNGDEYPRNEYMTGSHVWWRWADRVPAEREDRVEFTHPSGVVFQVPTTPPDTRPVLETQNAMSIGRTGQLRANTYVVGRKTTTSMKIVVVFQANLSNQLRFGGLWGDIVYDGELQFDLPRWSKRDFEQFIVNGIAPEHAFPGRE